MGQAEVAMPVVHGSKWKGFAEYIVQTYPPSRTERNM